MNGRTVLVLGGTRSGKSSYGMELAVGASQRGSVTYLATALPGDSELDRRIEGHQARRPVEWPTVLVQRDLAAAVAAVAPGATVLLDGLTLWLSGAFDRSVGDLDPFLEGPVEQALAAIGERPGATIIVSDEIGLGLIPMDPDAREFRDLIGLVHQRFAATADEVYLMVAGLPMQLKPAAR